METKTPSPEFELGDFVHDRGIVADANTLALVVLQHDPEYAEDLYSIRYFQDGHIGHRLGVELVKLDRAEAVKILCKNSIAY